MSDAEKEMYLSGAKLINPNTHTGNRSTSRGFCFAEITPERDADKWLRKLSMLTKCVWCVEFDTDDFKIPLCESWAVYADNVDLSKNMEVREWCTTEYSLFAQPYTRIGLCPGILGIVRGERIKWQK